MNPPLQIIITGQQGEGDMAFIDDSEERRQGRRRRL